MGVILKTNITLDNKSVRIITRLGKYLIENKINDIEKLISKDIFTQLIRVKGKEDMKVYIYH